MKKILAISTIILGINSYSQTDDLKKIKRGEKGRKRGDEICN